MSTNIDIFVNAPVGLESFVREIETLLRIKLQLVTNNIETYYTFRNSQVELTVGKHEFDNDRDLNFEDYDYDISVRALNIEDEAKRKAWRESLAYDTFEKLKAEQKYDLLMVENVQIKLAEFHPKHT